VAGGLEAGRRAVRLDFRERFTAEHMSRALAMVTRALGASGLFCYGLYCLLVNPRTQPVVVFHPLSPGGDFAGCLAGTGLVQAVSVMIDTMAFADTVMRRSLISCCSGFAHRQRMSAAR
jgi:hypothetical protein